MTYKNNKCPVCGLDLPQDNPGRRGRPRMYHPSCRKFEQLCSWLDDIIVDVEVSPEGKKRIRSRLWGLANLVNSKK